MKKSVIIAALGMAAAVASSYGQGYIAFNTYVANAGAGASTSYFNTFSGGPLVGSTVSGAFSAELYYALGTVSDPVNLGQAASIMSPVTGLTAIPSSTTAFDSNGDGWFQGGTVTIPGYSTGAVTFEIVATGTINGHAFVGRSGSFTESTIANSLSAPLTAFGDNGPGPVNFFVATVVPEPTTLALAGLGGLASLVALRRKQA